MDKSCAKKNHFLVVNPKNLVFHKNLDVFFLRFPNTHVGNILLIYDTPYKFIFNDLCSVIFLESFEDLCNNGEIYLLFIVFHYLVSFHSFGFNVQIYVRHYPFGTIGNISHNDPYYNMLFECCNDSCEPTYYIKTKLKKGYNIFIIILIITNFNWFLIHVWIKIICLNCN